MSADTPPGASFPENPDPDRTIEHRTPQPWQAATNDAHTQQLPYGAAEELGFNVPGGTEDAPAKRGRGWLIAAISALFVLILGGGGVWAFSQLNGGGTQPQDVLPGNAIAYLRLDLDPAANQKVALLAIGRKFPGIRDSLSDDDPRKALFEAIKGDSPDLAKVDYAKDVEPWLGDRAGLAVLPPAGDGKDPDIAVAVQVKDEAAARDGIAKLGAEDEFGLAFRDGYAILAKTQAAADGYAKAATLAQNAEFGGDTAAVGEPGVMSFWMNLGKLAAMSGAEAQGLNASTLESIKDTRFAGALRFDDDYAELAAITRGGQPTQIDAQPVKIAELPASTVGAVSLSGLGDGFAKQWPTIQQAAQANPDGQVFTKSLEQFQQLYGLSIPDDVVTLLGKSLTIALDQEGLDGQQPNVGAVLTTDPVKAQGIVTKLEGILAGSGAPLRLATKPGDGQLVVASSPEYADKLSTKGTLGDSESFKLAVPEADKATYAMYVDLDKLEPLYLGGMKDDEKANVQVLRAAGLSGSYAGSTEMTLRVLFN
ncbi:DUF3352 domain-containing protein [Planotetraspora kaengkrachanensis]|uniref:DUF3352 domain-containing protein n=1 Tax=Planotetraspora kaengkrachanensis TaxID=575193 RepID=A0A8J3V895_9ACTN|nr:DUF3352 domain-containing protein [Planotetraspora kaengkrachanensis]GIG81808.1 hypothetical protein Pka01_49350 [Planotetraspora kaengkrachanensis]